MIQQAQDILDFWFNEITPAQWWEKNSAFDLLITTRFSAVHVAANLGQLADWRASSEGRLAEIIVLDQFSRNIYRDLPQSFASDPLALTLAQEAIDQGCHLTLTPMMRGFMLLPLMHSESAVVHEMALALYTDMGVAYNIEFERKHKAIIDRFGRYPHRNIILGRVSTAAELAFLEEADSSF